MSEVQKVLVRDSDVLSAKQILLLLSQSIGGMRKSVAENTTLTDNNKVAIGGAIEALTDLHNMILNQLQNSREVESLTRANRDDDGFDA